jgi:hypothetical protein
MKKTHLHTLIRKTDKTWTKTQRRFAVLYILLFGKGLNGDRKNTASGKTGGSTSEKI